MSEIKLRAWDEVGKLMHYDFQYIKSGDEVNDWIVFTSDKQPLNSSPHPLDEPYLSQQFKITQYTGLKDKNGVEIYEGDIISYWNGTMIADKNGEYYYPNTPPHYFSRARSKVANIIFDKASFKIKDGNSLGSQYLGSDEVEVIGNIYENPELLEADK